MAQLLGVSYRMVGYWASGRNIPGLVYAFKIEQATQGGVPATSWLATSIGQARWRSVTEFIKPKPGSHWQKKREAKARALKRAARG